MANQKMTHQLIKPENFEINWQKLGKWDYNGRGSKLSMVIYAIIKAMN